MSARTVAIDAKSAGLLARRRRRSWPRGTSLLLATSAVAACGGNAGQGAASAADVVPGAGAFQVYAEGLCPKLSVYDVGDKLFLVYGTYGLDAVPFGDEQELGTKVTAAQSFAEIGPNGPVRRPELLAGLPMTKDGWVRGDVDMGGRFPSPMWLARVETSRGAGSQGVLYERNRLFYAFDQKTWNLEPHAKDAATIGVLPPDLPKQEICASFGEGIGLATYAAERLPSGDSLVAGRCEDSRHRAQAGVHLASFRTDAEEAGWTISDAPPADLFASIVNLGLVYVARDEAYLYAYPPYEDGDGPAYLVRYDGKKWTELDLPFRGPIVSMAASEDGALWAVRGWSELWRFHDDSWKQISLPSPVYVKPPPQRLRLLEVQVEGGAVWVHGAYPIWLEGAERTAARGHVLFSTRSLETPFYCDRRKPARKALTVPDEEIALEGAEEIR